MFSKFSQLVPTVLYMICVELAAASAYGASWVPISEAWESEPAGSLGAVCSD